MAIHDSCFYFMIEGGRRANNSLNVCAKYVLKQFSFKLSWNVYVIAYTDGIKLLGGSASVCSTYHNLKLDLFMQSNISHNKV